MLLAGRKLIDSVSDSDSDNSETSDISTAIQDFESSVPPDCVAWTDVDTDGPPFRLRKLRHGIEFVHEDPRLRSNLPVEGGLEQVPFNRYISEVGLVNIDDDYTIDHRTFAGAPRDCYRVGDFLWE